MCSYTTTTSTSSSPAAQTQSTPLLKRQGIIHPLLQPLLQGRLQGCDPASLHLESIKHAEGHFLPWSLPRSCLSAGRRQQHTLPQ